jgi:hypothetical protein
MDKRRWGFLALLLLASGAEFLVRGPIRLARTGTEWNDFLSPYIQAKAWTKGMNPYSAQNFVLLWPSDKAWLQFVAQDAANGTLVAKRGVPSPYPLTSFALLAPFSLLPWPAAQAAWAALNLAAFATSLAALLSLSGVSWREPRALLFLAMGLALAPFHTGIATENPVVLVVGLCVAAVWAANRDRNGASGILLGIAVCLKPQVGLCFLFYYLLRRRWKIAAIVCTWTAVVALIAVSRLAMNGVPWLTTYLENNNSVFGQGAINDFTPANPIWSNMINLQVLLFALAGSAPIARILALMLGALLFGVWLGLSFRYPQSSQLLHISSLVVISLLPIYHRFYDAALLIWPLCWSLLVAKKRKQERRLSTLTLLLILPFLVPGASLLDQLVLQGRIPAVVVDGWWWNAVVMTHQVWALLLLSLLLLYTLHAIRGEQSGTSQTSIALKPEPALHKS